MGETVNYERKRQTGFLLCCGRNLFFRISPPSLFTSFDAFVYSSFFSISLPIRAVLLLFYRVHLKSGVVQIFSSLSSGRGSVSSLLMTRVIGIKRKKENEKKKKIHSIETNFYAHSSLHSLDHFSESFYLFFKSWGINDLFFKPRSIFFCQK